MKYQSAGWEADGGATFAEDRTTVDVTSTGFCGATKIAGALLLKQR